VRASNGGAGYIGSHKVSSARRQASVRDCNNVILQLTVYLIPILAELTQNAQSFQWSPPIIKTHFEGKLQASAKGISISEMPKTDGRNERLLPVL